MVDSVISKLKTNPENLTEVLCHLGLGKMFQKPVTAHRFRDDRKEANCVVLSQSCRGVKIDGWNVDVYLDSIPLHNYHKGSDTNCVTKDGQLMCPSLNSALYSGKTTIFSDGSFSVPGDRFEQPGYQRQSTRLPRSGSLRTSMARFGIVSPATPGRARFERASIKS